MWKNSEKEDYLTMSKLGAGVKSTKYWLALEQKDMRYACDILENFEVVPNMVGIKEEYRKDVEKCIEELYQIYGTEFMDKIMNDVCDIGN